MTHITRVSGPEEPGEPRVIHVASPGPGFEIRFPPETKAPAPAATRTAKKEVCIMARNGESRAFRIAAKAVFGGALAALLAVPAGAAWDGRQAVRLGDSISAEFEGAPGAEVHTYSFFAAPDAVVTALIKGTNGLVPRLDLLDAAGQDVDTSAAEKPTGINKFRMPAAGGAFSFQVVHTSGAGIYTLKTKATYPKVRKAQLTTTLTYQFGAPKGTLVTAAVKKAKNSGAVPQITKLAGPQGDVANVTPSARISRVAVPVDGNYTLTVANTGVANDPIDLTVQLTVPKAGRSWNFGVQSATLGTASAQRTSWLTSGHADTSAAAFTDWNDAVPAVIPTNCARCHSGGGYEDYLGADGSAAGTIEVAPAAGARTVDCNACHNAKASNLTEVTFPSGQKVTGLGDEARCMVCHQGRESTKSLETAITTAKTGIANSTDDTVFPASGVGALTFKNVHYFAAGATLYGRQAEGAYEYPDPAYLTSGTFDPVTGLTRRMPYDRKFAHVGTHDTCIGCHDPHTLQRKITECATCHVDAAGNAVADDEDLKDVRMAGTTEDYDGDGNVAEGVYYELKGMADILYAAMRDYARSVALQPLVYDGHAYPYYFKDTNDNGVHDAGETASYNGAWTPRLLRAAYNYQYWNKDPGAHAHNAKYLIEVLYDGIADIHAVRPVAGFAGLHRNDETHFNAAAEAYRDWDTDGLEGSEPAACSRCHSGEGFEFVVANPNERNQPYNAALTSGMTCESCHVDGANFSPLGGNKPERLYVQYVTFPYVDMSTSSTAAIPSTGSQITSVRITNAPKTGGAVKPDDSFLCLTCHQGRQSKLTLDGYVATRSGGTLQTMSFQNVHYLVAGGVQYSTKAGVGYPWTAIADKDTTPFPGARTYQGPWTHGTEAAWAPWSGTPPNDVGGMNDTGKCSFCHMQAGSHRFDVPAGTSCTTGCHVGTGTDVSAWRKGAGLSTDFDGNAATTKLHDEVTSFKDTVLKALNTYAAAKGKRKLAYDPAVNSYFFYDDDGNGVPDSTASAGRYAQFDRFMLYGAHDMHMSVKDPGSWAHNARYILQLLYDAADYLDDETWNGSPVNATTGNPLVRPTTTY